jgi:hypothetical protein
LVVIRGLFASAEVAALAVSRDEAYRHVELQALDRHPRLLRRTVSSAAAAGERPDFKTRAARVSGAMACYPAFAPDDRTSGRNPPYAIRFASKPEFDESINLAILGSAATFSLAKSRASRDLN